MSHLLTDDERSRFCRYLRDNIESSKAILNQFDKLPASMGDAMGKRERQLIAGMTIVLQYIENAEQQTI